ncbi:MAG: hypothetical protein AAGD01_00615 [Acidobacteriota bacterium]
MDDDRRSFAHLPSWKHLLSLTLLGVFLLTIPSSPATADRYTNQWTRDLDEIHQLIKVEKYGEAEKNSRKLLEEINEKAIQGSALYPLIGKTMAYRAIAFMGRGEAKLAMWDFSVAQAFYPEILPEHLDTFGPAGQKLHLRLSQSAASTGTVYRFLEEKVDGCEEFQLPAPTNKVKPSVPRGLWRTLRQEQDEAYTKVGAEIDAAGQLRRFHLVSESKYPTINLEASEELRATTFQPGTCDGEPVAFMYDMWMTFAIERGPRKLEEAQSAP